MSDHAARAHKRYAASAASRWMACPGSVRLCDTVPEPPPSSYALEGTLAHEQLEAALRCVAELRALPALDTAVSVAVDYAAPLMRNALYVLIEKALEVSDEVGGTVDLFIYSSPNFHIIDYKHGAGVAVEARGNKQLRIYALAALLTQRIFAEEVTLTIIQPRAFHPDGPIRSETISVAELLDFQVDLEAAIRATQAPDAPLVPGAEQCRWCPAKLVCPAREKMALDLIGGDFGHVNQLALVAQPKDMGLDFIVRVMKAKGLVEDWFKAVEEEAYRLAMSGVKIPGFKLAAAIGRRSWEGEPWDIAPKLSALAPGTQPRDFIEQVLIGVTEADKLVKGAHATKAAKEEAMKQMAFLTTKKSSGKLQLVPEDDKRSAVDPAKTAFEGATVLPQIT